MFSENIIINIAHKYVVEAICNYGLAQYEKTGSYSKSLDIMRQMFRDAFVSSYDSAIKIVNQKLARKIYQQYIDKTLLLDDGNKP